MSVMIAVEPRSECYLMHYRTKGSKNGVRLYQNKDGSYTPLGRIHYGIGQGDDRAAKDEDAKENKNKNSNTDKKSKLSDVLRGLKTKLNKSNNLSNILDDEERAFEEDKQPKAEPQKAPEVSSKETAAPKADTNVRAKPFATLLENYKKTAENDIKAENKERKDDPKNIRNMSDEELKAAINRLQQEKQLYTLTEERRQREMSPIRKLVSETLMNTGKRIIEGTMNAVADKAVDEVKKRLNPKIEKTFGDLMKTDLKDMKIADVKDLGGVIDQARKITKYKEEQAKQDANKKDNKKNDNKNGNKPDQNKPENRSQNPQPTQDQQQPKPEQRPTQDQQQPKPEQRPTQDQQQPKPEQRPTPDSQPTQEQNQPRPEADRSRQEEQRRQEQERQEERDRQRRESERLKQERQARKEEERNRKERERAEKAQNRQQEHSDRANESTYGLSRLTRDKINEFSGAGMDAATIARVMGLPEGVVYSYMNRQQ